MTYISLRTKLGLLVGGCSFIIIVLLVTIATVFERNQAIEQARLEALLKAESLATRVQLEFEKALSTARTLAQAFSTTKEKSLLTLERGPANAILRGVLVHNPAYLAVYSIWEPNAFDNLDVAFVNWEGHDHTGRFIPYWVRTSQNDIVLKPTPDYTAAERGDLYNFARITLREVIQDPVFYTSAEMSQLVVSIAAPIVLRNEFLGITGVDLHTGWLQHLVDNIELDHQEQVAIVANNGSLVALSRQPEMAGRFLADLDAGFIPHLPAVYHGRELITTLQDELIIFTPIQLGDALASWSIKLKIPEKRMTEQATINMWRQISVGLAFSAMTVLLILFLVERMIHPLIHIATAARKLARGNLDYEDVQTARDEIGLVNASFRQMSQSIRANVLILRELAVGNFNREAILQSDEDELGQTINQMVNNIRKITRQLNLIAQEGYATRTITPFSERDQLGIALADMSASLNRAREENKYQQELQNGRMKLNDCLRGEQDLTELARNIVQFICRHLNFPIGALYVMNTEASALQLTGSYAYQHRRGQLNRFALGEGLVGQTALEKIRIIVTSLPADYVPVQSGLGQSTPQAVILTPLIHNHQVRGVLELGALTAVTDDALHFLDLVAENIAIALHTCQAREHTQLLLAQTREQAELLQRQQAELKQSNTDLAEQTRALKASEARLQLQQEELRQTNEELQEQAQLLEEQKEDIQKKNLELEMARTLIEEKARDLEITGKYKSEFLANMSHELRTPLNSILLLAKMIGDNRDGNLNERQVEFARTIHASGTDLLTLINDVLDLSKIEAGRMDFYFEEVPLSGLVRDLVRSFEVLAQEKGLEFRVELAPDCPERICTDRQRVSQVLKNFLSNAFKFTRQGQVSLSVARPDAGVTFKSSGLQPYTALAFRVQDTGIGIAPDKQKIIFEAFQQADGTTSRQYGGTGLGLSISVEIAKQLGGEIQLYSVPEQGSCFTLYLPQTPSEKTAPRDSETRTRKRTAETQASLRHQLPSPRITEAPPSLPPEADVPPANPDVDNPSMEDIRDDRKTISSDDRSILIVEDDPHFARILADLSREKGYKVLIAANGETGLHFADYFQVNGILLDVDLPGLDGWAVLARLKEQSRTRHIPVHFISATDQPLDALQRGAIGFTSKPIDMEDLEAIFQRIAHLAPDAQRRLLLVEDNPVQRQTLIEVLAGNDLIIQTAETARQTLDYLEQESLDGVILDLGLPDISGPELLTRIRRNPRLRFLPIIIYTGWDLRPEDEAMIGQHAEKIIIKGVNSLETLLDETTLFLHRVISNLSSEQQQMLAAIHDADSMFANKKILLVDDDMRNVFALSNVLESKGVVLRIAKNGRQALEALDREPDVNLVLMDIMMPVMDGYEAMRAIRKQPQFQTLPMIALTAKAMKGDRALCIEAGASDYLAKPFDMDKLLSMLRVWLY